MSEILGVVFYTVVVFAAGVWVGAPMFSWLQNKMPWSK